MKELRLQNTMIKKTITIMPEISLAISLWVLLLCSGLMGCSHNGFQPPKRVIFIVIDSLRADRFEYMDYSRKITPVMDKMIEKSVNYEWAFSSSNVTRRSVTSYMTGKIYSQVHDNPRENGLPSSEVSLASAFKNAGFRTSAFVTNGLIIAEEGMAQGFDRFEYLNSPSKPYADIREVTSYLLESYVPSDQPELVYIHIMDVHHPYRPPIPFGTDYIGSYSRDVVYEGNIVDSNGKPLQSMRPYYAEIHDAEGEDIEHLANLYDGVVEYVDGEISNVLKALGFDPHSDLLVLTADHGEQLFEHDFWRHGPCLIPAEIHVPLFFYFEGFSCQSVNTPVSLLDLYPTFCEMFELEMPVNLAGVSLMPSLLGGSAPSRKIYSETPWSTGPAACIFDDPYLYWAYADTQFYWPERVWPYYEALFNTKDDPYCLSNIIAGNTEKAEIMNSALRKINPLWELYNREVFCDEEDKIQYGPDIYLPASFDKDTSQQVLRIDAENNTLHYQQQEELLLGRAEIQEKVAAHVLEFEYSLKRGKFMLEVRDNDDSILWQYTLRKPAKESRKITSRIYPKTSMISIHLMPITPGAIDLFSLKVRRVELPVVPLGNNRPDIDYQQPPEGLTDHEKQVLETLGYL